MRASALLRDLFLPPRTFSDLALEADFLRHYCERYCSHRRAAAVLGLATWLAYLCWDAWHGWANPVFAEVFPLIFVLRAIGAIGLTALVMLCLKPRFQADERYATAVLMTGGLVTYGLLLAMIHVAPFPYNYLYYYVGLYIVALFLVGFLRLRARPVFFMIGVFAVLSAITFRIELESQLLGLFATVKEYYWMLALTNLAAFSVIGCAIAVELERKARDAFYREKELETGNTSVRRQNQELADLNRALEESRKDTETKTQALIRMKENSQAVAEQQSRDKSKFLAQAAHDLKQPMQAIGDFLEAAGHAMRKQQLAECGQFIQQAQAATRVMRSSFNTVLDISLLESGFVEAAYSAFDVQKLVEEVVGSFQGLAQSSGVRLSYTRRRGRPAPVRSDRVLLKRVLSNLVSNGIKYADPSKHNCAVIVGVVRLPTYVRLEILDNGKGIPQSELRNVFKPFHQLENPDRDREKGLGLGLAIVNAILGLLQEHRLETTSVEGKWTRFSIELPRAEVLVGDSYADLTPRTMETEDLSGLYVVLVENDSLLRKSTAALLEQNGALCEVAQSLEEFVALLSNLEREPDVILTDYRLPNERTAVDVVKAAAFTLGAHVPTVVFTGEVADIEVHDELRGKTVLRKPVAPHRLIEELSRAAPKH